MASLSLSQTQHNLKTMPLTPKATSKILQQAQSGNLTPLKNLRTATPDFHWSTLKYENNGDTALHCAARLGHTSSVEYLLSFSPSGVNCKNNDDKTPLHEAAQFSQPHIVQLLLENGGEVNALKRGDWTPLMLACTKKCFESVRRLVESGGLINYRNKDGWSCVHLAAREGSLEIFVFLVENGGDCGIRTKNGRSVLHIAALHGNGDIVEFVVSRGILSVDVGDNCGNTPLHEGVLGRHKKICEFLIQNGADRYCRNNVDFSILHLASSEGYNDLVEFVVQDLGFSVNLVNSSGFSALHCAARKGQKSTCELLARLGCDGGLKDKFGRTAFDYL